MHINFTITDEQKHAETGPIQVGWFLADGKASILYDPPYRMRSQSQQKHAKSASRCPAVVHPPNSVIDIIHLNIIVFFK